MAQDYPTPAASLSTLRDDLAAQLTGQGVDPKQPVPPLPKAGNFTWSCESLSAAAHALYQLAHDAIVADPPNIPAATHYYQSGHVFEDAHNAQCPEV